MIIIIIFVLEKFGKVSPHRFYSCHGSYVLGRFQSPTTGSTPQLPNIEMSLHMAMLVDNYIRTLHFCKEKRPHRYWLISRGYGRIGVHTLMLHWSVTVSCGLRYSNITQGCNGVFGVVGYGGRRFEFEPVKVKKRKPDKSRNKRLNLSRS